MRRLTLNLVLLLVVAGLGLAVWFSQEKTEQGPPLTALSREAIDSISVQHPGHPEIRLQKQDGQWRLVAPIDAPTDPFEINGILALVDLEAQSSLDASQVDRAELGLDPPGYTVTLNDQKIAIGGTEPIKYRRYVEVGAQIVLVDDPPSAALDSDYSDLVSRRLLPENTALKAIELPAFSIRKNQDGQWRSEQHPDVDPSRWLALVDGWRDARAMWNGAQTPETELPDDPRRLRLIPESGEPVELLIAEDETQLVLLRADWKVRYTLSKALLNELFQPPAEPDEASESNRQAGEAE